jgi:tetratricopeptide (TPR) repeat protein
MNYEEYVAATQRGSKLLDDGDREGAIAAFRALAGGDLPDLDRSVMCANVAIMLGQKDDASGALEWYDKGVALEAPHNRYAVLEMKAAYLVQLGRPQDALPLYRQLLLRRDLNLKDRERVSANVKQLDAAAGP